MSILIKGMEMPTSCADCKLRMAVGCCGNLPHNIRMPNCPLIELPPHGDLIDRYAAIRSAFKGEQNIYCWDEIEEAIDSVPAIIESEGEDG